MYRHVFNLYSLRWEIQMLRFGFFWTTLRGASFTDLEDAKDYVSERALSRASAVQPHDRLGNQQCRGVEATMKPLPPGDSASCPDEDAYQPEALKVQVGGNHYKNFDALQPAGFIDGGIFSEEEWGVRCPEALYRRPF